MFHILEVKSKTVNAAEVIIEKVGRSIRTPHVVTLREIRPGDISGFFPRWGLRGCVWVILIIK